MCVYIKCLFKIELGKLTCSKNPGHIDKVNGNQIEKNEITNLQVLH